MFALYAYMRLVDDIADAEDGHSVPERIEALENWRALTHSALAGDIPQGPHTELWPAFADMARRHNVPHKLFDDAIAGQQRDLTHTAVETFDELHHYCYQVAGVVGLASIHIWGFDGGAETESLAIARGVALQLTNILRDLREDAAHGRLYLPREDLKRMNVDEVDVLAGRGGREFLSLMRFQIERAESYYEKSRELESRISADTRPTLIAMTEIYHRLLRAIAHEPEQVLHRRVSLSAWSKLSIGWKAARMARAAKADDERDAALAAS